MAEPLDLKPVLWGNLQALMAARWGKENITRLAEEAEIGAATVQRYKRQDTEAGLDKIAAMAGVMGVLPWQLLVPDIDPARMPRLDKSVRSPQAADLAASLDKITDPTRRQQAYAAALAVIALAAPPGAPAPPPEPGN